jgi:MobA/MobL family
LRSDGARFGFVQRSRGQSASARSSYQRDRFIADVTTQLFFQEGERHVFGGLFLPDMAPSWANDPVQLWSRASAAERRRDAVEARTVDVALPRELPAQGAIVAMSNLAKWFRDLGLCVQLDLHDGAALDGGRNPHAHLMIATRVLSYTGFENRKSDALEQAFRRDRGRWLHQHIANIINKLGQETLKRDVVYSGPSMKLTRPEPRLPRWQAKSQHGREFLYLHRLLPRLDELEAMERRLQTEIEDIAEAIGDIDWYVSGYLGRLQTCWESDPGFRPRAANGPVEQGNFDDDRWPAWISEDDNLGAEIEMEPRRDSDSDHDIEQFPDEEPEELWSNDEERDNSEDWEPDESNEY